VIGVAVLGVDRGRDGLGLVPRGGIDARQDALRLGISAGAAEGASVGTAADAACSGVADSAGEV